jgi:hypothetical protein
MTIPAPRLRRILRLVLADPERARFIVRFDRKSGMWALPAVAMGDGEGVHNAAARFLRALDRGLPVRIGATMGRRSTGSFSGSRSQERWLPVRLMGPPVPAVLFPAGAVVGWHPFHGGEVATEELRWAMTLAQGYWEGWLPDGGITLED